MKIWKKIIFGFITVILIMMFVDYQSLRSNILIVNRVKELELSNRIELSQSNTIAYQIQRIKSNVRELFLEVEDADEPDEIIRARKYVLEGFSQVSDALNKLKEATKIGKEFSDDNQHEIGELDELVLIDSLSTMVSSFESSVKKSLILLDENKFSLAEVIFEDQSEDISRDIQDLIMTLIKDAEEEVDNSIKLMGEQVDRAILMGISMTLLSIILAFSIGLYISRSISAGLSKLIDGTNEISKGNLETLVSLNTNDELELLGNSFNNMAKELKMKITAIDILNKNLVESNTTKDTFFSIIAHDLKNPFNVILGYSELLSDNYQELDDAKRQEFISEIFKSSKITYELLDDLLTWARAQSGRIQINKENINIHTLIEKSIETYQVIARQKNIEIINNIPVSLFIMADIFTFTVMINNTINNAIKFTSNGGNITITAKANSETVELSIKDSGVGMSQEAIENLIQHKKSTSTQGTNNEAGTGLGLLLIKDFISKNDGQLSIDSEIGRGSEFRFLFTHIDS